jgi:hypothetical protein
MVDEGGDIAAVMLDRALVCPAGGLAVAAQVAGDDFVPGFQRFELELPIRVIAGKTVNED